MVGERRGQAGGMETGQMYLATDKIAFRSLVAP